VILPRSSVVCETWSEAALMWRASLQPSVDLQTSLRRIHFPQMPFEPAILFFALQCVMRSTDTAVIHRG
jgi:hypothetical protein